MVELIAYCVYATLPPRGPQVANAKRFCYSVCQLFGTSLWFHFLFVYLLVPVLCAFGWSCFAILCVCLWVKFSGFWLAKFLHCHGILGFLWVPAGRWIQWNPFDRNDHNFRPAISTWCDFTTPVPCMQCSATQSTFITHTRRGTKPSCGAALSQGLRSFCSSRRAVVHFQFV